MNRTYTQLFIHCVWSTWERMPLITPFIEANVYACIAAKCRELKCAPLAIGGIVDHVHLLVCLSTSVTVAQLVGATKGASSYVVSNHLTPDMLFRWQQGYGAFSIDKARVPGVITYIKNQKSHHHRGNLVQEWENWEA